MRSLCLSAVLLASLLASVFQSGYSGNLQCDKHKSPCSCEGTNISMINLEKVLNNDVGVNISDPVNSKYFYTVSFCSGIVCSLNDTTGDKTAAACQFDSSHNYVSTKLGEVKNFTWDVTSETSFAIVYAGGTPTSNPTQARVVRLEVTVVNNTVDIGTPNVTFIMEDKKLVKNTHTYRFSLLIHAKQENQGGGGSKAGAIGLVLISLVIVAILAYFIIGSILMYTLKGARGIEVIPNYTFWRILPILIKDGFMFTISPCLKLANKDKSGYQSL